MTQDISITPIPNGVVLMGTTLENFLTDFGKIVARETHEQIKLDVPEPYATIKIDEAYAAKYNGRGTVRQRKIYMAAKASKMGLKVKNGKQGTYIYKRDELKFLAEFGIYKTK